MSLSNNLPDEIITSILSRLPVKSLLRFKCVSKTWYSLIAHPDFIKMHLNLAIQNNHTNLMFFHHSKVFSIDHDTSFAEAVEIYYPLNSPYNYDVMISTSCNGLLFIIIDSDCERIHAIWNPCTREFKKVPAAPSNPSEEGEEIYSSTVYGLGYDCRIDDYKLMKIVQHYNGVGYLGSETYLYTLGANSWRKIDDNNSYFYYGPALFVNGNLDWRVSVGSLPSAHCDFIVSFDFVDERFYELPTPGNVGHVLRSSVLEGKLCLLTEVNGFQSDLWVMKDYGVRDSWTKLFTISLIRKCHRFLKVLSFSESGQVVLLYDHTCLFLYYPKLGKAETLHIRGTPDFCMAKPYVGSLISLKSGTYVEGRNKQ